MHKILSSFFKNIKILLTILSREKIFQFAFIIFCFVILGAALVFLVESTYLGTGFKSYFDAIWWAIVTITGVGYGDLFPIKPLGRIFACLLMFSGITMTSLLSGTVASIIVERKLKEEKGLEAVKAKKHILVCGWNRQGEKLIDELILNSNLVKEGIILVNEMNAEDFQLLRAKYLGLKLKYVRGNFVDELVLKKASAQTAKAAILLADSVKGQILPNADEKTILAALALRSINQNIILSAEIVEQNNENHLKRAGVDNILVYGEYNSYLLAASTKSPGLTQAVKEFLSSTGENNFYETAVPASFWGKTFKELAEYFLNTKQCILIGFRSAEERMKLSEILADDSSAIDAFIKKKFEEAEIEIRTEEKEEVQIKLNPGKDYVIQEDDTALVIGK